MRIPLATALLLASLGVAPAQAQMAATGGQAPTARGDSTEVTLLQIAQDVDEALLREAMMNLGRLEMVPPPQQPEYQEVLRKRDREMDALAKYIKKRSEAITARAGELKKKTVEAATIRTTARVARPESRKSPEESEAIEKAKVQVQRFQASVAYAQQALKEAIDELARAEIAGDEDVALKDKLEAARKKFEKAEARHVEFSKRLRDEFARLNAMEPQPLFGGMGGGIGGMSGTMGGIGGMM